MASAFLAVLYSDYMLTSQTENLFCSGKMYKPVDLRIFAISQVCISIKMTSIILYSYQLSSGLFLIQVQNFLISQLPNIFIGD
jgi:hypothetical protein